MFARTWLGVVIAATCGCDTVFGLDRDTPPDAPLDGPPDAHIVGVATLVDPPEIGGPVVIGEVWPVTTKVHGTAGEYVPFSLSATAGTFAAGPTEVLIDAGGITEVVAEFTAPSTRTVVTMIATSAPRSASKAVPVLGLQQLGPTIVGPGATTFQAGTMFGIRISFQDPGYLRRLGVVSKSTCMAKLALYQDFIQMSGTVTKVTEIGPVALTGSDAAPAINSFAITPALGLPIPAGDYWLVAVADATLTIPQQATTGARFMNLAFPYAMALPAQLPFTPATGQEYAMFAVVAK